VKAGNGFGRVQRRAERVPSIGGKSGSQGEKRGSIKRFANGSQPSAIRGLRGPGGGVGWAGVNRKERNFWTRCGRSTQGKERGPGGQVHLTWGRSTGLGEGFKKRKKKLETAKGLGRGGIGVICLQRVSSQREKVPGDNGSEPLPLEKSQTQSG